MLLAVLFVHLLMQIAMVNSVKNFKVTCADLDISQYQGVWTQEELDSFQKYGKFLKFSKLDISNYALYCDALSNAAVRDNQNQDGGAETIAYSYERNGWNYGCFPPIVSSTGKIKDGRTRIRAAILQGWKYIPVAVYTYPEEFDAMSDIVDGIIANDHLVASRADMNDFVRAGISAISRNLLNPDYASIESWLYNEVEVERFFSNIAGTITKIVNRILTEVTPEGDPIVLLKDRSEWIDYLSGCKEVLDLGIAMPDEPVPFDENQLVFYSTGKTNARRCWIDHILANAMKGHHTYVVLYSTDRTAEKVRENTTNFQKDLEMFYAESIQLINNQLNGISISVAKERPFTVLGVIPQFADDENHKQLRSLNRLVPLDRL